MQAAKAATNGGKKRRDFFALRCAPERESEGEKKGWKVRTEILAAFELIFGR
jgi:hypothetical protein